MITGLDDFRTDLFQEVIGTAGASKQFLEEAFLTHFTSYLIEAGEVDTFDPCFYRSPRGLRVDGYAGDPAEHGGVLTLFVADFHQDNKAESLTHAESETIFKRLERFLEEAMTPALHKKLEESSAGYGLAELIHTRSNNIYSIRLFLLSNRVLSTRAKALPTRNVSGIPTTFNIWDLSKLHRVSSSKQKREDIDIDVIGEFGEGIPCLPASVGKADYEAYLAVVPGKLLSELYGRWGARLLEQNVRCFLQARGGVNKGIRNTILNKPDMFFAYNNGITATAESVETVVSDSAIKIVRLKNLQIVNGGQTIASIFNAAMKDSAELENIFVQMKLSVIQPEQLADVVPKISEFANSQNRVNAADFFANHPFHILMEEISRRLWTPSVDGTHQQSKWFYERARGQYLDSKSNKTKAEQNKFDREYPRSQLFNKTDLAKFENSWEGLPHVVSTGAQKNFANFAGAIGKRWEKSNTQFNEVYFKNAVAKAIIFRTLERLVLRQPWYDGGYRANIVTYTIAKLAMLVKECNSALDFDRIWRAQKIDGSLEQTLLKIAAMVSDIITDPQAGMQNVTEWAKKQACWERVQVLEIKLGETFMDQLLGKDEQKKLLNDGKMARGIDNGIEAQTRAVELGSHFWKQAIDWGLERHMLSEPDHTTMSKVASIPNKIPTEKESILLMTIIERLREESCPFVQEI